MTGSVPTSYIEITGYPEAGSDPQVVDFVVSYGFVTTGGEEAIGHLKTKLVNIRPGTVTGAAAPGPVPPGPVGDAALGDFPPPPGGFCVDTVPVPYPVCWTVHLTNQSVNLPGTVAQCSMDWGWYADPGVCWLEPAVSNRLLLYSYLCESRGCVPSGSL